MGEQGHRERRGAGGVGFDNRDGDDCDGHGGARQGRRDGGRGPLRDKLLRFKNIVDVAPAVVLVHVSESLLRQQIQAQLLFQFILCGQHPTQDFP